MACPDKIRRDFEIFLEEGGSQIGVHDLKRVLQDVDESLWSDGNCKELLREIDANHDERIDYNEFSDWIAKQNERSFFTNAQYAALITTQLQNTLKDLGLEPNMARFMIGTSPDDQWSVLGLKSKAAFEKYGDVGGNLQCDGMRVRTPWAGFPPEFWSSEEAIKKYEAASGEKLYNPVW